jgi:RNA polymerase sigma factor (sigma-70 family)
MARRALRPDTELTEMTGLIRRVITARVARTEDVEDLVQETLVRVAGAQDRLGPDAIAGYAVVTARNVVATKYRNEARDRRHIHRLVEYTSLGEPEELTLRREESDALAAALAQLSPGESELLVAHEVDGMDLEVLGAAAGVASSAMAMRLSRARARLRLEFVLALRDVHDLDPRCRAVLLSLSAADSRRQEALHAGAHIAACPVCSQLSEPLIERRRAIAGWFPIGIALAAGRALRHVVRTHPVQAGGIGATVAAGVVVVAVAVTTGTSSAGNTHTTTTVPAVTAPAQPAPALTANGTSLLPVPSGGLAPYAADDVQGRALNVLAVVPAEGAWIGNDPQHQVWIEFTDPTIPDPAPGPIPPIVTVGAQIDFAGRLSPNPADYATQLGFDAPHQALLDAAGYHLHVDPAAVTLTPSK